MKFEALKIVNDNSSKVRKENSKKLVNRIKNYLKSN